MTPREIEEVLKLDGPARFKYFVKWVVAWSHAWGLWDAGWASGVDDDGVTVFPLWPAQEYAERSRTEEWTNFQPKEIPIDDLLNDLIPMLAEKGMRPGIFPTPSGKWVLPTTDELRSAIRKEMELYE
jgi:hypothetical protein